MSFGERLSTRLFAAFLRREVWLSLDALCTMQKRLVTRSKPAHLPLQGVPAVQHDAWVIGMTTTDDFTEAEVNYQATLPLLRASLTMGQGQVPQVPIVTGFLGRGLTTGAFCLPAHLA